MSRMESYEKPERSLKHFFRVDLLLLRIIGMPSLNNAFFSEKLESSWWECGCFIIGISTIVSVIVAEIVAISNCHDLNYSIKILSSMCSGILCATKGMRLWTCRHVLHKLLRKLSISWDSAWSRGIIKSEIVHIANGIGPIRIIYGFSVALIAISYALGPCIIYLEQRIHQTVNTTFDYSASVFPTSYPFTISSFQRFFIFTTYQQLTGIVACLYWISCDILFVQITTHISLQFTLLGNSVYDAIANARMNGYTYDIKHELKDIVKKHNELFTLCCEMEMFFNPVIFLTILSNGVNLCCSLYQLDQQILTHDWNEITKNVAHVSSLIIQTVIFCGYAEKMTQSSIQIGYSAYHSQWIELTKQSKVMLLMIMMRTAKQYNFTVYGMLTLNLNRVTAIFNGATSYFMLLKKFS